MVNIKDKRGRRRNQGKLPKRDSFKSGHCFKMIAQYSTEIFEKGIFVGQRYRRMEDQKPWPGLAINREFSKGRGLKPKVTNENIVYSNVSQTGIWGRSSQSLGDFLEFKKKRSYFNALESFESQLKINI